MKHTSFLWELCDVYYPDSPLPVSIQANFSRVLGDVPSLRLFDQSANFLMVKHNLHRNKTILNMTYVAASTNISTPGICQSTAPLFRV
ncbi:hypothetical protein B0H13DRAFT_2326372 [Mycena leptocephala]|nr:hypothetical protein B0H13DRAFT_2326372 [Mycena leptocephala]